MSPPMALGKLQPLKPPAPHLILDHPIRATRHGHIQLHDGTVQGAKGLPGAERPNHREPHGCPLWSALRWVEALSMVCLGFAFGVLRVILWLVEIVSSGDFMAGFKFIWW